ncbi:MAG: hypothetical protein JOZ69_14735, partial [Myxococcales bacterium]|nr:hypothetical protein [Myxococcales bacterium]
NNENPLVTVHFNTPVNAARLVPHGRDLWFVVDLRAAVQPTTTMEVDKTGVAVLSVVFPKGDYLPAAPGAAPAASTAAASPHPAPPGAAGQTADAGPTPPARSASLTPR